MGKNVSIAPVFRTKSPHRGVILFRTVEDAGPYNGANDNLKQLDKPGFDWVALGLSPAPVYIICLP
jgi:hypothetical protein